MADNLALDDWIVSSELVENSLLIVLHNTYFGLSEPNVISWSRLISNAQSFLYRAWWLSVFPGLAIVVTIVAIALVIDELRRN